MTRNKNKLIIDDYELVSDNTRVVPSFIHQPLTKKEWTEETYKRLASKTKNAQFTSDVRGTWLRLHDQKLLLLLKLKEEYVRNLLNFIKGSSSIMDMPSGYAGLILGRTNGTGNEIVDEAINTAAFAGLGEMKYALRGIRASKNLLKSGSKQVDGYISSKSLKNPIISATQSKDITNGVIENELLGPTSIPYDELRAFENSTLQRMANARQLSGKEREDFIKNGMKVIGLKYNRTNSLSSPTAAGETIWNTGEINIRPGRESLALGHEMRHKLDAAVYFKNTLDYTLTPQEYKLLRSAYTGPFLDYPSNGNMLHEMSTTNSDVRKKLIGRHNLINMSVEELNALIDKATGTDILNALRDANDYGYEYYRHLVTDPVYRTNNALPLIDILRNIKQSLKYVGAYSAPIGITYPSLKKQYYEVGSQQ